MDEDDSRLEYYLEIGAIEIAGMDESGEIIFAITEKAKDVAPELWEAHQTHVDEKLIELLKKGLIRVEYNENLEAMISMSEEGLRLAKEFGIIPIDMDTFDIPNN
jgi:hypothetical protein